MLPLMRPVGVIVKDAPVSVVEVPSEFDKVPLVIAPLLSLVRVP